MQSLRSSTWIGQPTISADVLTGVDIRKFITSSLLNTACATAVVQCAYIAALCVELIHDVLKLSYSGATSAAIMWE